MTYTRACCDMVLGSLASFLSCPGRIYLWPVQVKRGLHYQVKGTSAEQKVFFYEWRPMPDTNPTQPPGYVLGTTA